MDLSISANVGGEVLKGDAVIGVTRGRYSAEIPSKITPGVD